jgi:hypothetical protein
MKDNIMEIETACRLIGYGIEFAKSAVPAAALAVIAWRIGV